MSRNRELLLNLFNMESLIVPDLLEDWDRVQQLYRIADWYEDFNSLPHMIKLAEQQLQYCVQVTARAKFADREFEAFYSHWRQLSFDQKCSFLRPFIPKARLLWDQEGD